VGLEDAISLMSQNGMVRPWAIVQVIIEPSKLPRVMIPILIAAFASFALPTGVVARNQRARALAQLQARSLSEEQRTELKRRLPKDIPPIRIVYRLLDGGGKDFSEQLGAAIKDAGGTVLSIAGNSLNDLRGKVRVAVNAGETNTQDAANRLCDTLSAIKIPCGGDLTPGSFVGLRDRRKLCGS
jgi:hypothetical protein